MSPQGLPTVSDCEGCGVCCLHMGYPAFIEATSDRPAEEHWRAMPESLRSELLAYIVTYPPVPDGQLDGPCVWFDEDQRRCRHHEHRPRVCRDFQIGGDDCLAWREFYGDRVVG